MKLERHFRLSQRPVPELYVTVSRHTALQCECYQSGTSLHQAHQNSRAFDPSRKKPARANLADGSFLLVLLHLPFHLGLSSPYMGCSATVRYSVTTTPSLPKSVSLTIRWRKMIVRETLASQVVSLEIIAIGDRSRVR